MYTIEVNSESKIFLITLRGVLSQEEGKNLFENLSIELKNLNSYQYLLIIDMQGFETNGHNSLDNIKEAGELLFKTPFKGVYKIKPVKNAIVDIQPILAVQKQYNRNYSRKVL